MGEKEKMETGRSGVLSGRVEKREVKGKKQEKQNKVKAVIFTPSPLTVSLLSPSVKQKRD